MKHDSFRFQMDILRADGSPVQAFAVSPAWEPAIESVHSLGIRRGRIPPVRQPGKCEIKPVWDAVLGVPFVAAFRIVFPGNKKYPPYFSDIPVNYLSGLAQQISVKLQETGELQAGELFRFQMSAYPNGTELQREKKSKLNLRVREDDALLPLEEGDLAEIWSRSEAGFQEMHELDFPVFIAESVLEEVKAISEEASPYETGGLLVGYLRRDCISPETYLEVTAQVPATQTRSSEYTITFTADTWRELSEKLESRSRNEIRLGWYHSHPFNLNAQKDEADKSGELSKKTSTGSLFLSAPDVRLHQAVFPRAYSVALVVGQNGSGDKSCGLFGWRLGRVESTSFRILKEK